MPNEEKSLLDREPLAQSAAAEGHSPTLVVAGWFLLILVLAGVGYFSYRVWYFADAAKRGQIVAPPTFSFQSSKGAGLGSLEAEIVDRSLVEAPGRPNFGPSEPKATVVVFADFRCPFCHAEAPIMRRMMTEFGGQVKFIFRHFTVIEPVASSFQLAEAGECAREQGLFWEMHDRIFADSGSAKMTGLLSYAQRIGASQEPFEMCMADGRYRHLIEADLADGREAGVTGTPTFFIDGQRIEGAIPENIFRALLQRAIAGE